MGTLDGEDDGGFEQQNGGGVHGFLDGYENSAELSNPFEQEDEEAEQVGRTLPAEGGQPSSSNGSGPRPPEARSSAAAAAFDISDGDHKDANVGKVLEVLVKLLKQRGTDHNRPNIRLAKMPGCGDHVLPGIKEWRQWYDVKVRSWAGAQAVGFADALDDYILYGKVEALKDKFERENQTLAYEVCHMVDGRLLSHLVKVDKTDGAKLLKTLHSVVTRGSAERTAALHARFAAQTPCRSKEQLLHGLQVWREDLEELQAAGSSPSKETVLSSLKMLVSGVRELKNVIEITELMAPGNAKRLYTVVHKKAADWAVLDCDPRTNGATIVNAMVVKNELCKFHMKGLCRRGENCRYSHEVKPKAKGSGKGGTKGKKNRDKDRCFNCGKVTDPPHRAADCPEKKAMSASKAEVQGASSSSGSPSTPAPSSRSTTSPEKVQELAKAYMAELSRGVPVDDLLRKLACPAVLTAVAPKSEYGVVMVADSGAELHIVGKKDHKFMMNSRRRSPPCILDTANGKVVLDKEGDIYCGGIFLKGCVYNPYIDFSLLSVSCLEKDGWTYIQGGGRCSLEKGGYKHDLVRSGGLYLLGAEGMVLASVEATSEIVVKADDEILLRVPRMAPREEVPKSPYERDGIDLGHLRMGHKPFDPDCSTCQLMKLKSRQHRRIRDEQEMGQVSVDLAGPWPQAWCGAQYLLLLIKRDTRFIMVAPLPNKTSAGIKEAMVDFKLTMKGVWRMHSDRGKEFLGAMDVWMRETLIVHSTTAGYDSQANGIAERAIQEVTQGIRSFLHQSGAPRFLWSEAAKHFCNVVNRCERKYPDDSKGIPLILERKQVVGTEESMHEDDDPRRWPPWGCRIVALIPKVDRDSKLDAVAVVGAFLGYDQTISGGVRVAVLKVKDKFVEFDKVIVSTTVRTKDEEFPFSMSHGPSLDELKVIEASLKEEDSRKKQQPGEEPAERQKDVKGVKKKVEKRKGTKAKKEKTTEENIAKDEDDIDAFLKECDEVPVPGDAVELDDPPEEEAKAMEVDKVIQELKRGADLAGLEEYSHLDDVPLSIKKNRLAAMARNELVVKWSPYLSMVDYRVCSVCLVRSGGVLCENCIENYLRYQVAAVAVMNARVAKYHLSGGEDPTMKAYMAAVKEFHDEGAVKEVLGRQAAFITKDLDPTSYLGDALAVKAMQDEFTKLDDAMDKVIELDDVPEDAIIVKAKLLLGIKNWEDEAKRKFKSRMVVMGNVLYDKFMRIKKDASLADLWAPVASLTGVRLVEARAAAHGRRSCGIDLIAAYTQIPMGGDKPYYIILPQVVYQVMSKAQAAQYEGFKKPVRKALRAWYGIQRSGSDFIVSFGRWLEILGFSRVPEEPALFVYWQTEGKEALLKKARYHKERLIRKFAEGINPLLEQNSYKVGKVDLEAIKRSVGTSSKCALMSTYVDDCSMDAKGSVAGPLWEAIRTLFASDDPADVQRIVGLTRVDIDLGGGKVMAAMSQEAYLVSFIEGLPAEYAPRRAMRTNGQGSTAPDPKELEMVPCPPIVRSIVGTLMYAARCTRPDIAYPVARLARYLDRWSDPWLDRELRHIIAYVYGSTNEKLGFKYKGDLWEDLVLEVYSDANFAAPCSEGGYAIFLAGDMGTELPVEWKSRKQRLTATSSAESEIMELCDAIKAVQRLRGVVDSCRFTPVKARGFVDNDSVRIAVERGSSLKLAHMRKHAEVSLTFVQESEVSMHRVDTSDNPADIFTKILSSQRLAWHMARFSGKERVANEHGSIVGCAHYEHLEGCLGDKVKEITGGKLKVCACRVAMRLAVMSVLIKGTEANEDNTSDLLDDEYEAYGWVVAFRIGVFVIVIILFCSWYCSSSNYEDVARRSDEEVVHILNERARQAAEFDAQRPEGEEQVVKDQEDFNNMQVFVQLVAMQRRIDELERKDVQNLNRIRQLEMNSLDVRSVATMTDEYLVGSPVVTPQLTVVSSPAAAPTTPTPMPPPSPTAAMPAASMAGSSTSAMAGSAPISPAMQGLRFRTIPPREGDANAPRTYNVVEVGLVPGDGLAHVCGAGVRRRECNYCRAKPIMEYMVVTVVGGECFHKISTCTGLRNRTSPLEHRFLCESHSPNCFRRGG